MQQGLTCQNLEMELVIPRPQPQLAIEGAMAICQRRQMAVGEDVQSIGLRRTQDEVGRRGQLW